MEHGPTPVSRFVVDVGAITNIDSPRRILFTICSTSWCAKGMV
jgi:hypothetical protein